MAEEFIARGHVVAGCSRSEAETAKLQQKHATPHLFTSVDVLDAAAANAWAKTVFAQLGPPDLLVNNAALINRSAPLWELEPGR